MADDLISRQAALDAIKKLEKPAPTAQHLSAIFDCEDIIKALPSAQPTVYGYDVKELIVFADAVRKKGITESEIHEFALNAKSAYEYAWEEFQRTQKEALDSVMRGDQT